MTTSWRQHPDGIRLLDLSSSLPGAYCCRVLAELGAEVISVWPPGGSPDEKYFPDLARWEYSNSTVVEMDLKAQAAHAEHLLKQADAYLMGFRPGSALALRFDPAEVLLRYPRMIGCWIRGFAEDDERRSIGAHDLLFEALAGVASPQEQPPPVPVVDLAAGLLAAIRIQAALLDRNTSSRGAAIELAMSEVAMSWGAVARGLAGRLFPSYGGFCTRDGHWIAIGFEHEDSQWRQLCESVGLSSIAPIAAEDRQRRSVELRDQLRQAIGQLSMEQLERQLVGTTVAWGPFSSAPWAIGGSVASPS
jgi:crotonobetainyl-CoA:carnitine CoA-transferase CaiB-like acyl-CoA transferase